MSKTVYVFRLAHSVTAPQLNALFSQHGTVESAQVMVDPSTGQSRGFGFVEMATTAEASAASTALDGTSMAGRTLRVKQADTKTL
jgi:RNA recognition motif-containing protein